MESKQQLSHGFRNSAIGVVVSAAALWFTFHGVDFQRLVDSLSKISILSISLLIAVNLLFIVVRAYRWQWLLRHLQRVPLVPVYHLSQIGALANNVLPLRIGEVVRAILLKRRYHFSGAQALGNIVLERMIDLIALVLMLIVAIASGHLPKEFLHYAWSAVLIVSSVIAIILTVLKIYHWRVGHAPERKLGRIAGLIDRMAIGMNGIYHWQVSIPALLLTFVMWLISAMTFIVFAGDFPQQITLPIAISVSVLTAIGATIPAAPGFVGTYHLFCKLGLVAYGMPEEQAVVIAFLTHIVSYLVNNITGVISMLIFKLHWRDILLLRSETVTDDTKLL